MRYKWIVTIWGPPWKKDLWRSTREANPSMRKIRWGVCTTPYQATRNWIPGGRKLTHSRPIQGTHLHLSSPPYSTETSTSKAGIFYPYEWRGPLVAQYESSTAPRRNCEEYQTPERGPQREARTSRQRDVGWRSRGWPGRIIESARDALFRPGRTLWRPPALDWGYGPPLTQYSPVSRGPPGLSAFPGSGLFHPCAPPQNVPRGLRRARLVLRRSPEPPPLIKTAEGDPGQP